MIDSVALYAVARGTVQGVYYRSFTSRTAIAFGLTGYVRNLPDNSVEVYAEGERKQLEKLISQLQSGPPGARVDDLDTSWSTYTGRYRDFSVM